MYNHSKQIITEQLKHTALKVLDVVLLVVHYFVDVLNMVSNTSILQIL